MDAVKSGETMPHGSSGKLAGRVQSWRWLGLCFVALVLVCLGSCAQERTNGPTSDKYSLLVADPKALTVFYVDPETNAVVDSLWSVGAMLEPALSPEGRWIYMSIGYEGLYKFDLETKLQTALLPPPPGLFTTRGEFTLVKEGTLLLEGGQTLNLIDPDTLGIIGSRSFSLFWPRGAHGRDFVVGEASISSDQTIVGIYDFVRDSFDSIRVASGGEADGLARAYIHPDGQRVFAWDYGVLHVVDLLTRGVTTLPRVPGGWAHIVFNRAGTRAYLALDHGEGFRTGYNGRVLIIDCNSPIYPIIDSLIFPTQTALSVALSPDESQLYIGLGKTHSEYGRILIVDPLSLSDSLGGISHGTLSNPQWLPIRPQ